MGASVAAGPKLNVKVNISPSFISNGREIILYSNSTFEPESQPFDPLSINTIVCKTGLIQISCVPASQPVIL